MRRHIASSLLSVAAPLALLTALSACDRDHDVTTADNTAVNERDRNGDMATATDQSESPADRETTRRIRAIIVADDGLSTNAKNVKIVTNAGTVTLRGPVQNEQERTRVASAAQQVAGEGKVQNQLEVAGR
jgi:hyperosmotically inducible periplasmic protein